MKREVLSALSALLLFAGSAQSAPAPDAVIAHYADLAEATYGDSLVRARDLQSAVDAFLAHPAPDTLAARAAELVVGIGAGAAEIRAASRVGGGALPLTELEGPAVALDGDPDALAAALRAHDPPVIARVHNGRVVLDPRTLTDEELPVVVAAVRGALAAG